MFYVVFSCKLTVSKIMSSLVLHCFMVYCCDLLSFRNGRLNSFTGCLKSTQSKRKLVYMYYKLL